MFGLLWSLIYGAIVGWLAGKLMNSQGGIFKNMVIGCVGGMVGHFLLGLLGFSAHGVIARLIVSVVGACIAIAVGRKIFRD